MIALPGLTLATGRSEAGARDPGRPSRGLIDQGMLPNVLPGRRRAARVTTASTRRCGTSRPGGPICSHHPNEQLLEQHFPLLEDIVRHYRDGTRYGIGVDPADGLLRAGEPGVQLTWMDAKVGDWVVTPRHRQAGRDQCPVVQRPARHGRFRRACSIAMPRTTRQLAEKVGAGFRRFVRGPDDGLFDVLDGPNEGKRRRPLGTAESDLRRQPAALTAERRGTGRGRARMRSRLAHQSIGLRSLAPDHPDYRRSLPGRCPRPRLRPITRARSGAGCSVITRWPNTGSAAIASRPQLRLRTARDQLFDAGLGTISEIFDGDPPHPPRGAPAQAWSVACILEAWWRLKQ